MPRNVSAFSTTTANAVALLSTTASTSSTTGALVVPGGVGIGGNLNVAGTITGGSVAYASTSSGTFDVTNASGQTFTVQSTEESTSTTTGSANFKGGVSIVKNLWVGGTLNAGSVTYASTSTGSMTVTGSPGTTLQVNSTQDSVSVGTGAAVFIGGIGVAKNITALSQSLTSATQSTSNTTGALTVVGGVGIGGNLNSGGTIYGGNAQISGTVQNKGFDFVLGNGDQVTRGNSGSSRALVKLTGNILGINYQGDYTGGIRLDAATTCPSLTVDSALNVSGSATINNLSGTGTTNISALSVGGNSTFTGLMTGGSSTFTGVTVSGDSTFSGVTCNSQFVANSGVTLNASAVANSGFTVSGLVGNSTLTVAGTVGFSALTLKFGGTDVFNVTETNTTVNNVTVQNNIVCNENITVGNDLNVTQNLSVNNQYSLNGVPFLQYNGGTPVFEVPTIQNIANTSTDTLEVKGFDMKLGNGDQVTRGDSGASRALVKENPAKLVINYAGDYTGGVEVQSDFTTSAGKNIVCGNNITATGFADIDSLKLQGFLFADYTGTEYTIGVDGVPLWINGNASIRDYTLRLGNKDTVRGDSGASRALVKETGNILVINYGQDYTGGVQVQSDLSTSSSKNITSGAGITATTFVNAATVSATSTVNANSYQINGSTTVSKSGNNLYLTTYGGGSIKMSNPLTADYGLSGSTGAFSGVINASNFNEDTYTLTETVLGAAMTVNEKSCKVTRMQSLQHVSIYYDVTFDPGEQSTFYPQFTAIANLFKSDHVVGRFTYTYDSNLIHQFAGNCVLNQTSGGFGITNYQVRLWPINFDDVDQHTAYQGIVTPNRVYLEIHIVGIAA